MHGMYECPCGDQRKHQPHDEKILHCKNMVSNGRVEPHIKSQRCTGHAQRALFNPNLNLIIIYNPFLQSITHIGASTVLRQLPVRMTTVKNNRMHNRGPTCSPVIFAIALYGARIVHLFIQVCVLFTIVSHHRPSLATSATNILPHLRLDGAATKQRSRCMAQIARATWHATKRVH